MANDSTHEEKVTPATDGAHARQTPLNDSKNGVNSAANSQFPALNGAHARHVARLSIDRNGEIEWTVVDNKKFFRDTNLGRILKFARPRDVRKPIMRMIERGEISEDQFILVDDEDGGQVVYLDNAAAMKLAVRTKSVTEDTIMQMLAAVSSVDDAKASMTEDRALVGYNRTLAFICKKDTQRSAKLASLPVLEKYARAAGIQTPDLSELIGPDQPPLPGV